MFGALHSGELRNGVLSAENNKSSERLTPGYHKFRNYMKRLLYPVFILLVLFILS